MGGGPARRSAGRQRGQAGGGEMKEPLGRIEQVPVDIFEKTIKAAQRTIGSGKNQPYDWTSPGGFMRQHLEEIGVSKLRRNPSDLVDLSNEHADNFSELVLGLAHELEAGQEIPEVARLWLAKFLRAEIKPPPQKRGPKNNPGLEILIYFSVEAGVKNGLTATRNDEAKHKRSACDAVACALGKMQLPYSSFEAVKNIWEDGRRLRQA